MRVLFLGTWSMGGFGKVTRELGARMVEQGIDVRIVAVDHRGHPVKGPLAGRVWPAEALGGSHGSKTHLAISGEFWRMLDYSDDWLPDAILAIEDMTGILARMNGAGSGKVPAQWFTKPMLQYAPIEGGNLPPLWKPFWQTLFQPIAMSKYGADQIEEFLGLRPPMVYHGVDHSIFRPVSFNDPIILDGRRLATREQCKTYFSLNPNRKLVLRSDAPVPRKHYELFIRAMAEVVRADPDVDVLIHASAVGPEIDLQQELMRYPDVEGRIFLSGMHDTFQGLPEAGMAALMNAADLYVSTTGGEGFGLNLAEAISCETPVIVTDWAADAEVVGPGGVVVPPLIDRYGEPVLVHSQYGMDWSVADWRGFVQPTLDLLAKPSKRRALGKAGRAHALTNFSWDFATTAFITLLEQAIAVFTPPSEVSDANTADRVGHEDPPRPDDVRRRLIANGAAG